MDRRKFVAVAAVGLAAPALIGRAFAADQPTTLNLGFQKTGIPLVARQLKVFEKRFEPKGIAINWVEFTQGLLLLQALDLGDISFGNSGNVGCVFVQAAGGHITYVAAQPSAPVRLPVVVDRTTLMIRQHIGDMHGLDAIAFMADIAIEVHQAGEIG